MPDACPQTPPVVRDTAPVVGRRILCTHCNQPTIVYEIPCPYLNRATYVCGDCRDQDRKDAEVQAEAESRRSSFYQAPALPFNERNVTA